MKVQNSTMNRCLTNLKAFIQRLKEKFLGIETPLSVDHCSLKVEYIREHLQKNFSINSVT